LTITIKPLARYDPTPLDPAVVDLIATSAEAFGQTVRRMQSGAGHDAQAFAPNSTPG
jgi:acetylornithine deacetylase/succinyl-diaminopimelate desuccinylase-like protein